MASDYESVFYPIGPDKADFDWYKCMILQYPTDKLIEEYKNYQQILEEHRLKEPAKKRKNKPKYRMWVSRTHDYLDMLNDVYKELKRRNYDQPL